jgi:protein-tyrosine phosphatase
MDRAPLIPSLPNLRDLGGHPTRGGGRVRRRLLYRSTELSRLEGTDASALARLAIRSVYDLRTREEREMQPDRIPAGAELVVIDVLEGSPEASPAKLMELFSDVRATAAALGGGGAIRMFEAKYREFVSLASARSAYGRLFSDVAAPEHRPALFHCTTGKDRTGWAAAALLMLLDVPDEAIERDFLRSNDLVMPTFRHFLDRFAARGGDPALLVPLIEVRPSYLATAIDEMRRTFGTIEGYFADGLGIDLPTQAALRTALIEHD